MCRAAALRPAVINPTVSCCVPAVPEALKVRRSPERRNAVVGLPRGSANETRASGTDNADNCSIVAVGQRGRWLSSVVGVCHGLWVLAPLWTCREIQNRVEISGGSALQGVDVAWRVHHGRRRIEGAF